MEDTRDPYENLAQAIILNAVKDYRTARHKLKYHPKNTTAERMLKDCERFFRSEWFIQLSGMDGKIILEKLQKEET